MRGLARIAATHGHHFIVTGLTSLTKDICREAFENAEPLAPHETEELFTISHEQVGLLYGADLARISEERTMVPDLVMMELDRHAALGARYVEPYILQWVRQGKAGILPPVSGALTPRFLERLQNAGLMDLKRMALFQEIPAVFGKDRLDLLAEAMVTLGFWTPLPAGAADEQPDDVRLYDYASVWDLLGGFRPVDLIQALQQLLGKGRLVDDPLHHVLLYNGIAAPLGLAVDDLVVT